MNPPRLAQKLLAGRCGLLPLKAASPWDDELPHPGKLSGVLSGATIVNADDVAERFFADTNGVFEYSSIPNVAPPFELCWIECDLRRRIGQRWGVLWKADDYQGILDAADIGMRWSLYGLLFVEFRDRSAFGPAAKGIVGVAPDGSLTALSAEFVGGVTSENLDGSPELYFIPSLLAMALMHCTNVRLTEHPLIDCVSPGEQRHGRIRKPPTLRFVTIDIEPMIRSYRERITAGDSFGVALSKCRGHFKDFREHGLFGKTKGIFWCPEHLRGDPANGVVVKRHRIPLARTDNSGTALLPKPRG